ncbi:hypothetical protein QVD17_30470 [Tagetes erecta]|uniref:Transposase-associated domain-containing protein n=1 Tax=Tagetes erecta TaxID=13708 RepID=A0AAD8NG14_TARER|nr:hypothetical protein QVD17_30470 [Tagetes erecta]
MDMSWMSLPRATTEYEKGLDKFLDFIFSIEGKNGQISCPCIDCGNQIWVDKKEARTHLQCVGFIKGYKTPLIYKACDTPMMDAEDDMQGLVHDAFQGFGENRHDNEIGTQNENRSMPNTNAKKFYKVLEDAKKELYPGFIKGYKTPLIYKACDTPMMDAEDDMQGEHLKIIRHENQKLRELEIQRLHSETFESWFQDNSDTSVGPQLDENMNIELVRVGLKGTFVDNNTLVFGGDEDT